MSQIMPPQTVDRRNSVVIDLSTSQNDFFVQAFISGAQMPHIIDACLGIILNQKQLGLASFTSQKQTLKDYLLRSPKNFSVGVNISNNIPKNLQNYRIYFYNYDESSIQIDKVLLALIKYLKFNKFNNKKLFIRISIKQFTLFQLYKIILQIKQKAIQYNTYLQNIIFVTYGLSVKDMDRFGLNCLYIQQLKELSKNMSFLYTKSANPSAIILSSNYFRDLLQKKQYKKMNAQQIRSIAIARVNKNQKLKKFQQP